MKHALSTVVFVLALVFFIASASGTNLFQISGGTGSTTGYTWAVAGSVSAPSTGTAGSQILLTATVTSYSASDGSQGYTVLQFLINGNVIGSKDISAPSVYTYVWVPQTNGSFIFTSNYVSEATYPTGSGSPIYSSLTGSVAITINDAPPSILSASASPDPVTVGNITTFGATVNWGGDTGSLVWNVSGGTVITGGSGDQYAFNSAGTYTVTALATNAYGSATKSFTLTVTTGISPVQHIGHFYISFGNGFTQLGSSTNLVYKFSSYPAQLTVLYVEDNGTTTNFSGAYVSTSSSTNIPLSTSTTYQGFIAFSGSVVISSAGTYTIAGGVLTGTGSAPLQIFSIALNMQNPSPSPSPINISNLNIPELGVSIGLFALAGVLFWKKH